MEFKEWSETAESEYTCEFGRDGIRDIYTIDGVQISDEVWMPRSIFKSQTQQTLVDVIYPAAKEKWLKDTYGAEMDYLRYTEDGYGYPVFKGAGSTERAFAFIKATQSNLC